MIVPSYVNALAAPKLGYDKYPVPLSYNDFAHLFPDATANDHAWTMELMALGEMYTPMRAAGFLSILDNLKTVDRDAFVWHSRGMNAAADDCEREAIYKVFKRSRDGLEVMRRLRVFVWVLEKWV